SFEEYRRTTEITTDPTIVNQWKEEARKVMTFRTKDGDPPLTFENLSALEQHFRENYFQKVVKPCLAAEIHGDHVRHLPDRSVVAAIRRARERENRFPAQMAGALRHGLNQAGLHVFKHKKRILYISTTRPTLIDSQAKVSPGLEAILATLRSYPRITRKQLAEKVLKRLLGEKSTEESSPEYLQAKNSLPTDLLWLAKAGHVIEFADGTLDLPLPPKALERPGASSDGGAHEATGADDSIEPETEAESPTDVPMAEEPETEVTASEPPVEAIPIEEHAAVESHVTVEEHVSAEEHTPVAEHTPVVEHAAVVEDIPVAEHSRVVEHALVEEHVPVEERVPVEEHQVENVTSVV